MSISKRKIAQKMKLLINKNNYLGIPLCLISVMLPLITQNTQRVYRARKIDYK